MAFLVDDDLLFEDENGPGATAVANHARRRVPHAHVTIKYLEDDFAAAFVNGLAGLRPDGSEEEGPGRFHGRHLARNGAVGDLVFSSGLRLQEFTYVPACEIPPLPSAPQLMPIAFPLPERITKGSKSGSRGRPAPRWPACIPTLGWSGC